MENNVELRFYFDTIIVEAILSNDGFEKNASGDIIFGITNTVKNYVSNHIDPNDKSGSLLNMLAPGAISVMFSAMGMGKIGLLFGLAASVFHIDVKSILQSIYEKIKSLISGDKKVSSTQIDNAVQSTMQEHVNVDPSTDLSKLQTDSFQQEMRDAKIIKLALDSYDEKIKGLKKAADFSFLKSRRNKTVGIIGKILSWVFKIALASAGFMVAGDAVNKLLGRPNAIDGTVRDGKPIETVKMQQAPVSSQNKFPIKSTYVDTKYNSGSNWIEKVVNNKPSIENMIIRFVHEVYDGLNGQDNLIRSTHGFQLTAHNINWYNRSAIGDPIVFIPKTFTSKKQLVDFFIDQVAAKAHGSPNNIKPNVPSGSYLV